jgi:WD40 repeat protein
VGCGKPPSDRLPLTGLTEAVNSVAFSPDDKTLATPGADGSVRLWDVATHRQLGLPCIGHTDAVLSVAFSPDGKVLASGSADNSVRLWDVASQRAIGSPLTGHTDAVNSVAFSADGKTLASSGDKSIRLWGVPQLSDPASSSANPSGNPLPATSGKTKYQRAPSIARFPPRP